MTPDMSIISLFLHASIVVKAVMLLLLLASMTSWFFIVQKGRDIKAAREEANAFEGRFWSGVDLVELYKQVNRRRSELHGVAVLFEAGFGEFARLHAQGSVEPELLVEASHRAMRVAASREVDALELNLPFLATVGSTSPYVGLFGTVWGIMNSFRALGGAQQATLSMVAPGIAEALVATAVGLFAAIPAVIAYNRYGTEVERLANRYDVFIEEFTALLQRRAHLPLPANAHAA